jgi:oligoendopeptidase F
MYRDASAWEDDKAKLIALLPSIADYRGKLGNDGSTLLAAIEAIQAVETVVANLYVYAGLKNFEDTRISENGARFSEAQGLYSQFQQALAFFLSGALIHTRGHAGSLCGYDTRPLDLRALSG